MVKILVLSLIVSVLGHHLISARSTYIRYRRCPNKYICTSLTQCPRQSRLLHRAFDLPTALELFRKHLCGLHDGLLEVCCHEAFTLLRVGGDGTNLDGADADDEEGVAKNTSDVRHPNLRLVNHHDCGVGIKNRILGKEATVPGEFPWLALLQYQVGGGDTEYRCAGTLISEYYVLTSAHCVRPDDFSKQLVSVRLGEYNVNMEHDCELNGVEDEEGVVVCNRRPPQEYRVRRIVRHPRYESSDSLSNNIALVRLREKVVFEPHFVVPVCLPTKSLASDDGEVLTLRLVAAGWGITDTIFAPRTDVLLKSSVAPMAGPICEERVGRQVPRGDLCTGVQTTSKTSCQADVGGPLITTLGNNVNTRISYLVGVLAAPARKCDDVGTSVYTRVETYLEWILDNMED